MEQLADVFGLGEKRSDAFEQLNAVCRQSHLPRRTMQQARADGRFELLDGGRYRGAWQLQRMGRPLMKLPISAT